MKICENCGKEFFNENGNDEMVNFHRRRYCLDCTPEQPRIVAAPPDKFLNCIVCGNPLKGTQRKYCSKKCKVHQLSSYPAQQDRGIERKIRLIQVAGGACVRCGYNKNLAALEFHHIDPSKKKFKLDLRHLSNRTWESVLKEFEKTELLCSNCHSELHCPDMELEILLEKYGSKLSD